MEFYKKLKIGTKISITVTALTVTSLSFVGVTAYRSASDAVFKNLEQRLISSAKDGGQIIASKIKLLSQGLEDITYLQELQNDDWQAQRDLLLKHEKRIGSMKLGIADIGGNTNFTDGSNMNISDKDFFKKAMEGVTNISEPELNKGDNKLVMNIAAPIRDSNNRIVKILTATYDYSVFHNMVFEIKVGKEGYPFVLNKDGVKLAHVNNQHILNKDNDFENVKNNQALSELVELERKMVNGETGLGEYFYTGIRKYMSYAPIPGTQWAIGLTVPKDEFFEDLYNLRNQIIIATTLFILFGMALIIVISRLLISKPINKLVKLSDKMALGDVDVNIETSSKDEIGMLMNSFNKMVDNIREQANNAKKISEGNLNIEINQRSEKDVLAISMKEMINILQEMSNDANMLSSAAIEGKLSTRADAGKHKGDFRKIIEGVNNTLDAVIEPLNFASDYIEKMANGEDLESITQKYNGDFNTLMNNLGKVRTSLNILTEETGKLSQAALEGNLSVRGDLSKLKGNYHKIVQGFNSTLDSVITPLDEAFMVLGNLSLNDYTKEMSGKYQGMLAEFAEKINLVRTRLLSVQDIALRVSQGDISKLEEFRQIGKRSDNDKLVPAFTDMMDTIHQLINEVNSLTQAASEGNLTKRGNVDKFNGGYRNIVSGINDTMDSISEPLNDTLRVLAKMSQNDFTYNISGSYKGSFKELTDAITRVQSTLNEVLNEINTAANQVASGARQVSDSAQALSQGSTEQASSIEQLTASMEEISEQTKKNAENANQANSLALSAKDTAISGNNQMKEMLKAMGEINESSSSISKIIKVIDEIAFQTNILALNAAVEAARAGQYGKGFAVVAEEVRNLAERSANAAKETTSMIEGSITKVEDGTKIANSTADALNNIVNGVTKAAELVGQIAAASNEQASGIAQVNQGISQVSQVTQTNTATSEESAAASEELSSQSEFLRQMVGKFTLKSTKSSFEEQNYIPHELKEMLMNMPKENPPKKPSKQPKSFVNIDLDNKDFGKY